MNKLSTKSPLKIAVWGVAFKPGTDDVRESPSIYGITRFLEAGHTVSIYDPIAADNAKAELKNTKALGFVGQKEETLDGADVLCIFTEWKSFLQPDFTEMKNLMRNKIIFDGRNIYDLDVMHEQGFEYHSLGRPQVEGSNGAKAL